MTIARYLSFLLIGMFTSMVVLCMAFQLDFREFVSDIFDNLSNEQTYAAAAFVGPDE